MMGPLRVNPVPPTFLSCFRTNAIMFPENFVVANAALQCAVIA